MTDGELVKIMARVKRHSDAVYDLLRGRLYDHPNGLALEKDLSENGMYHLWDFASITHDNLLHPERWKVTAGKIQWIGEKE